MAYEMYCSIPRSPMICPSEHWEIPKGIPSLPVINTNTGLFDRILLVLSGNLNAYLSKKKTHFFFKL